MTYDVIIPARNEAATLGGVVRTARLAPNAGRVIVVDDHSSDETAAVGRDAGAEVIPSRGNGSKALALASGVEASSSPLLVFFDGDIIDARPEHFEALAGPVASGRFVMCCGLVDYGWRSPLFLRLPPITGLRALRRDVFAAVTPEKLNGFQIEIMINEVVARGRMLSAIRVLTGARHRSKIDKLGFTAGSRAHLAMTAELLHCLTFVPLWTYGSYLHNLTVLPSETPPRP